MQSNFCTDVPHLYVWKGDYKPFGEAEVTVSTVENNLRFPGQYFDQETGLHYNYFRDYYPGTGRYLTVDPIQSERILGRYKLVSTQKYLLANSYINKFDPTKSHAYVYVGNNPLNWIDPLGLDRLRFDGETIFWINDEDQVVNTYSGISGPYGRGRLPEGGYTGHNLRPRTKKGMVCEGAGWSLDLDPNFPTDRICLRMHPDQTPTGTAGCIGVKCRDAKRLHNDLSDYFDSGNTSIPVEVEY